MTFKPGPPPADATAVDTMPRHRALGEELRDLGVPVSQLRRSENEHGSVTWVELDIGGRPAWVGIPGAPERADRRRRSTTGLVITVLGFLLAAWRLSHRIARPLAALEAHLRAPSLFQGDANGSRPLAESGPLEVRHLIRRYNQYARERHQRDEERNMMLAALSHDLRSPLARIRMATALLPEHAPRRGQVARDHRSQCPHGRPTARFFPGPGPQRHRAAGRRGRSAPTGCIGVPGKWPRRRHRDAMPADLAPLPAASRLGLERALHNLLDNAVKYGCGPFEIAAGGADRSWWLSVRDHGPGIPADLREQLARPFYRGDHGRGLPGAGLGLAIVVATMERHGGALALADAGPGLRVTLSFGHSRAAGQPVR